MKTGICSITFRQFGIAQVVGLAEKAGLDAIEWGGDVHVPTGDAVAAAEAKQRTLDAGLAVSSYGSYCRILDDQGQAEDFKPVLETTLALGTDTVRVWAGSRGSDAATPEYRQKVIEETRCAAELAEKHNVKIAFEFHAGTLMDTNESAWNLLDEINHPRIHAYWQPIYWGPTMEYRMQGLNLLKEKILNFHVFHWVFDAEQEEWGNAVDRRPFIEGENDWRQYFSVELPSRERYALLEFVRDDDPEQFLKDAHVLRQWAAENVSTD